MRSTRRSVVVAVAMALGLTRAGAAGVLPTPDHLVVVVEENHSFASIVGNPAAPYINALAGLGANFTQAFATDHPSLPNYLTLFSGSNQGVTDDNANRSFTAPNLGAQLLAAGHTFAGYSENQPGVGALDLTADGGLYARKHNPWSMFQGAGPNQLPASVNLPFAGHFPTDYSQLPTVSFVAPNQINDMHGLAGGPTGDALIGTADTWLQTNLGGYVNWAMTHNSALWIVWDEDDNSASNHVPSILVGPMFPTGNFDQPINHLNILASIQEMYGLDRIAGTVGQGVVFSTVPEPSPAVLGALVLGAAVAGRRAFSR